MAKSVGTGLAAREILFGQLPPRGTPEDRYYGRRTFGFRQEMSGTDE